MIEADGRATMELKMFPDTGGYSRADLYRLSNEKLLVRDADRTYTVDLMNRTITQNESRREGGTFLGSFDVDDSKT
jgi:hypothetical protein